MKFLDVKCSEGYNYLGYNQFVSFSNFTLFSVLYEVCSSNSIDKIKNCIHNSGKIDGYLINKYACDFFSDIGDRVKFIAHYISHLGLGKFKVIRFTKREIVFIQDKNLSTKLFFKIFGKNSKIVPAEFTQGIFRYSLMNLFGKYVNINFKVTSEEIILRCDILDKDYIFTNKSDILDLPFNLENLYDVELKKVPITFGNDGDTYLRGIISVNLPFHLYFDLINCFNWDKNHKFSCGESIGKLLYLYILKLGIIDKKKIFEKFKELIMYAGDGVLSYSGDYLTCNLLNNFESHINSKFVNVSNLVFYLANVYKGFYDSVFDVTTKLSIDNYCVNLEKVSDGCIISELDKKIFKNSSLKF